MGGQYRMNLKEIGVNMPPDRDKWRALMDVASDLQIP